MKKITFIFTVVAAVMMLTSCKNEEKKVLEFATNFASKALSNDVRAVRSLYAAAELADSFAVDYDTDQPVIEEQDGQYTVKFDDNRALVISKDERGKLQVDATYGLFSFDGDLFDFAVRTGWIDPYMDDATIADRLGDYEFQEFMVERITKELRSKVTVTGGAAGGSSFHGIGVTVHNRTDYDIPGDAYKVLYRTVYWAFPEDNQTITFDGVDLPARSSKSMSGRKRGVGEATETSIRLQYDEDMLPRLCLQIYKGNGHEYADYHKGKLK